MSMFKRNKKVQKRADSFISEFRLLVEKHGIDVSAVLKDCPHCNGTGKLPSLTLVELKKDGNEINNGK